MISRPSVDQASAHEESPAERSLLSGQDVTAAVSLMALVGIIVGHARGNFTPLFEREPSKQMHVPALRATEQPIRFPKPAPEPVSDIRIRPRKAEGVWQAFPGDQIDMSSRDLY